MTIVLDPLNSSTYAKRHRWSRAIGVNRKRKCTKISRWKRYCLQTPWGGEKPNKIDAVERRKGLRTTGVGKGGLLCLGLLPLWAMGKHLRILTRGILVWCWGCDARGVSTFTLIPVALHNAYSYLHQIVKCMTWTLEIWHLECSVAAHRWHCGLCDGVRSPMEGL